MCNPIASKMVMLAGLGLFLAACGTTPTPPPDHPPIVVTAPTRPPPAEAPKNLVPAELRCKADDNCAMSSFAGCCTCCHCKTVRSPINKLVLTARRNRCAAVDCAPCQKKCAPCEDVISGAPGRAVCRQGRCTKILDSKATQPRTPFGAYE